MTSPLLVLVSAAANAVVLASPVNAQRLPVYEPPKPVDMSQVPQRARDAAEQELRGIAETDITCTVRHDDDGQTAYEFVAKDSVGAAHVIGFTADGAPALLGADEQFDAISFAETRQ